MLAVASLLPVISAGAQPAGELFPQAFVVEHHVVQVEEDGTRFVSESVQDFYFGSWLVSKRADGTRSVLDLARREITEIRPEQGVYWTVGFSRLAELQRRHDRLDELPSSLEDAERALLEELQGSAGEGERASAIRKSMAALTAELVVTEEETQAAKASSKSAMAEALRDVAPDSLHDRAGVRKLRIERTDGAKSATARSSVTGEAQVAEIWVDPSIRLSTAARAALAGFERDALGGDTEIAGGLAPAALMKAARDHADGAFPVRTRRPVVGGVVEDVTTRLEPIEEPDSELVRVPEGLRRIAHPLESAVAFMEREAERRELMGSLPE